MIIFYFHYSTAKDHLLHSYSLQTWGTGECSVGDTHISNKRGQNGGGWKAAHPQPHIGI